MAPRRSLHVVALAVVVAAGAFLLGNVGTAAVAQEVEYAALRASAEAYYAEGSYRRAQELYWQARDLALDDAERRWVQFRLGDSAWRAAAGSGGVDSSALEAPRQRLANVIDAASSEQVGDLLWADAHESLGDSWWFGDNRYRWEKAWEYYEPALDWWAGSDDLDAARERYLAIVWKIAGRLAERSYLSFQDAPPFASLDNAAAIATEDPDRARAHLLQAMLLASAGQTPQLQQRVAPAFEAALAASRGTPWRDDVLYQYGRWLGDGGRVVSLEDGEGEWQQPAEPARSLQLLRTLVEEFQKGETPHHDDATRRIVSITRPFVQVTTSNVFVPGSEVELQLAWRNVGEVEFNLHEIELHRSPAFASGHRSSSGDWLQAVDLSQSRPLRSWSVTTDDAGDHRRGQTTIRIDGPLAVGAYVIEATSSAADAPRPPRSRELVLVSDASLVLKRSAKQALVYFCDAYTGAPLADADVTVWEGGNVRVDGRWTWTWTRHTAITGDDGIAIVELDGRFEVFAAASADGRQGFGFDSGVRDRFRLSDWRVYAYTDRSAYRPGDQAHWKLTARRYEGEVYVTPAHQTLWYEVEDPRGAKVASAGVDLNSFGSAWGELQLTQAMPLGEYSVTFKTAEDGREIGSAKLLRLEEYKLPEFKVAVELPTLDDGTAKTFRPGEAIEATIRAEYYSGGEVADATVQVVVYQRRFRHTWRPRRAYAWYYDDIDRTFSTFGSAQVIERQTLSADAEGAATITFTPRARSEQDFEYRIEARVTDASRRQMVANTTVRVTRQRAFVQVTPRHHVVHPGDSVDIDFLAVDANDKPLQVSGRVSVTRDTWREGRRDYERERLVSAAIRTDAAGEAEWEFRPGRDGYYTVTFTGTDQDGTAVVASTALWAARDETTELGFRHGALGLIVDKDTFRVGETASVMLTTSDSGHYVLFSVTADDLYSYQLVHLSGTAKLVGVPIQEKHAPNVYLGGTMVAERWVYEVEKQVIVPPTRNFLEVEVEADADQHEPGEPGEFTVRVHDRDGRPVAAEVGFAVVDEATFYVQRDLAPDPRQFFYGNQRRNLVATTTSFHRKRYVDLVETSDGELLDRSAQQRARVGEAGAQGGQWTYDAVSRRRRKTSIGASPLYYDSDAFEEVDRVKSLGYLSGSVRHYRPPLGDPIPDVPLAGAAFSIGEPSTPGAQESAVQVRSDFRATAWWQPDIVTGADGTATVRITYPDSLTTWRATARVASASNEFGIGTATSRTDKPLIARLQAPRFFVVGDTATVSAVLTNNTDKAITATPALVAEGLRVVGAGTNTTSAAAPMRIPPHGARRVDWTVDVSEPGPVRLEVEAVGAEHSDAMERHLAAHDHGLDKLVAVAGKLRGAEVAASLELPAARQPGSTRMTVHVTPSVAVTMLDALPYLIDYPYGCTEQTISRFVPAVISTGTLGHLGLDPEEVIGRMFGGIEPSARFGSELAKRSDLRRLDEVVERGLTRLYDFQHDDGGWGWWEGGDSDHFMSAYVIWGLSLARDAGIVVKQDVLDRGVSFLGLELVERRDQPDLQAWMLHALAVYADVQTRQPPAAEPARPPRPERVQQAADERARFEAARSAAFDNVWEQRDQLNSYSRALVALSAHYLGLQDEARVLVRNLENGVVRDQRPDTSILQPSAIADAAPAPTAHWGQDGVWWRWSEGGVEATSFALRALLAIDPGNALIEPTVNWLIKNRRGAQWSNTRDTAIAVLALNDYLASNGELETDIEYELLVNGASVARHRLGREDILRAPSQFAVDPELVVDGKNTIQIVRHDGDGPLYFAAQATFVSREEPITAGGNEIFVQRQYNRLVGRKTLLKGYTYDRQPLLEGETITSGERLEVVIRIEAKNNYEYLMFEDLKPAGLEAVAVRSGDSLTARELESSAPMGESRAAEGDGSLAAVRADYTGRTRWVYQELRDRKVALFVDKLPQGLWEIRYQVRAEVPGEFHALPLVGQAMYVPEIRANGKEHRLTVVDRPPRR